MGRRCCVMNCPSKGSEPSHRMPKNKIRHDKWKATIKKFRNMSQTGLKHAVVCHRHFLETDYVSVDYKYRVLRETAIPSVNLPKDSEIQDDSKSELVIEMIPQDVSTNDVLDKEADPSGIQSLCTVNMQAAEHSRERSLHYNTKSKKLSPTPSRLYKRAMYMRKQYLRTSNKISSLRKRMKDAEKYMKDMNLGDILSSLTHTQKTFIKMQLRVSKYKSQIWKLLYYDIAKAAACGYWGAHFKHKIGKTLHSSRKDPVSINI